MRHAACAQQDRRRSIRCEPTELVAVSRLVPILPLTEVQVLNTSPGGIALRTPTPVAPGERLSFTTRPFLPPILGEVLACDKNDDGSFHLRCRCLLGSFGG